MTKLLTVIGEASGDLHGGNVLIELKKLNPDINIIGTGGKLFNQIATKVYYSIDDLAVVGFIEVIKKLKYLKKVLQIIIQLLDKEKPNAVFLVDYVGFNLKIAAEAKKRGIKVFFYISPQIWAWKKNRIKKIKEYIDELIVLFPFEVNYFSERGMKVHCFGHPLLELAQSKLSRLQLLKKWNLPNQQLICILPGSRQQELKVHLPILIESIIALDKQIPNSQFVFLLESAKSLTEAKQTINKFNLPYSLKKKILCTDNNNYSFIGNADLVLAKSGTCTLETAILGAPLIIFYRTNWATYFIGRYIYRVKILGLPNIIMKKKIVSELLQSDFNTDNIVKHSIELLKKGETYKSMQKDFITLKSKLGKLGAYKKTAQFLASLL